MQNLSLPQPEQSSHSKSRSRQATGSEQATDSPHECPAALQTGATQTSPDEQSRTPTVESLLSQETSPSESESSDEEWLQLVDGIQKIIDCCDHILQSKWEEKTQLLQKLVKHTEAKQLTEQ